MGVFDEVIEIENKIGSYKESKKALEGQKELLKKLIDDEFDKKISSCDNKIHNLKNAKQNYFKKIASLSTFNVDEIGFVLADLISNKEEHKYVYHKANYNKTRIFYEEGYGYDSNTTCERLFLIDEASKVRSSYHDVYLSELGPTLYRPENSSFILSKGYLMDGKISFYNELADAIIDTKKYDYVYDFINYVIEYEVENNLHELNKEDLYNLLFKFLDTYKKENVKVKKGNL